MAHPVRVIVRTSVALTVSLALIAIPALAQEAPAIPSLGTQREEPKSEGDAFMLSFFSTAAGMGLMFAVGIPLGTGSDATRKRNLWAAGMGTAMTFGPSAGYFYGGVARRGLTGIAIRAACAATAILTLGVSNPGPWGFLGEAALLVLLGSTIWDIVSVPSAVHEHNLEIARRSLTVAPVIIPDKKGFGAGLQFNYSF